ncbi:hypothetical protein Clacol_006044 [Clathrus columnatus]|uniref:Uncharacterized protein n=1 Tax=Clathrus columnatus TaxID=1419009 RepID=A0AAV5AAZ2_9AGAM|nr:hypothetical protein Clacol_006044 [Clathrus columnatus]
MTTTTRLTDLLANGSTNLDPGRVINISSVSAFETHAVGSSLAADNNGLWSYNASKAAVNQLTTNLATTLAKRVNAICPGVFPSKMTAWGLKEKSEKMIKGQPMGRLGNARDMAGVGLRFEARPITSALFLASPASAHITGAHILLDGGAFIGGTAHL